MSAFTGLNICMCYRGFKTQLNIWISAHPQKQYLCISCMVEPFDNNGKIDRYIPIEMGLRNTKVPMAISIGAKEAPKSA